jgi:hypothetical protein
MKMCTIVSINHSNFLSEGTWFESRSGDKSFSRFPSYPSVRFLEKFFNWPPVSPSPSPASQFIIHASNVLMNGLGILARIALQGVPGSVLNPETASPNYYFRGFYLSSFPPGKCWDIALKESVTA